MLEYIVEHREDDENMANMISSLAIPQSSFSRIQKKLCSMGLLERFQTLDNRKNVILKPTELALKAYAFHSEELYRLMFKPFFDELEDFSDEQLERFAHAIERGPGSLSPGALDRGLSVGIPARRRPPVERQRRRGHGTSAPRARRPRAGRGPL